MPYIQQEHRDRLSAGYPIRNSGELNYVISKLIDQYITENEMNYELLNSIIGVLECCKSEIYRRIITVYEENKIDINGDVFECVKNFE